VIGGTGELHIQIILKDLSEYFCGGIELVISDPIIPYRETIIATSNQICMSKSPNKHNHIHLTAEPLAEGI